MPGVNQSGRAASRSPSAPQGPPTQRAVVSMKKKNNVALARLLRIAPRQLLWDEVSGISALKRRRIFKRAAQVVAHTLLVLSISAAICFYGFLNPRVASVPDPATTVNVLSCHVVLSCDDHTRFNNVETDVDRDDNIVTIDGSATARCSVKLCVPSYQTRNASVAFVLSRSTIDLSAWADPVPFPVSITTKNHPSSTTQEAARVTLGGGRFANLYVNITRGIVVGTHFAADIAAIYIDHGAAMLDFDFLSPFKITGTTRDEAYCVSPQITAQTFITGPCHNSTNATGVNTTAQVCPFYAHSVLGSGATMMLTIQSTSIYLSAVVHQNETRIAGNGIHMNPQVDRTVLGLLADTAAWHAHNLQTFYVQVVDVLTPSLGVTFSVASRKVLMEIGPYRLTFNSAFVMHPHYRRLPAVLSHYGCPANPRDRLAHSRSFSLTAYLSRGDNTLAELRAMIDAYFPPEWQFLVAEQLQYAVNDSATVVGVDSQAHKRQTISDYVFGARPVVLHRDDHGVVTEHQLKKSVSTEILTAINYVGAAVMVLGLNAFLILYRAEIISFFLYISTRRKLRDAVPLEIPMCAYHYYLSFSTLVSWVAYRIVTHLMFRATPSSFIATYFTHTTTNVQGGIPFQRVETMYQYWALQRYDNPRVAKHDLTAAIESNGGQRLILQKAVVRGLHLRDSVPSGAVPRSMRLHPSHFTRRDLERFFIFTGDPDHVALLDDFVLFADDAAAALSTRSGPRNVSSTVPSPLEPEGEGLRRRLSNDSRRTGQCMLPSALSGSFTVPAVARRAVPLPSTLCGQIPKSQASTPSAQTSPSVLSGPPSATFLSTAVKADPKGKNARSANGRIVAHGATDVDGRLKELLRPRLQALGLPVETQPVDVVTGLRLVYDDTRHRCTCPACTSGSGNNAADGAIRVGYDAFDTGVSGCVASDCAHSLTSHGVRENVQRMERWFASWPKEHLQPWIGLFAVVFGTAPLTRSFPSIDDVRTAWAKGRWVVAASQAVAWALVSPPSWGLRQLQHWLSFISPALFLAAVLSYAPFVLIIFLNVLGDYERVKYAVITDRNTIEEMYATISFAPGLPFYQGGAQSLRTSSSVWALYVFIILTLFEPFLVAASSQSFGIFRDGASTVERAVRRVRLWVSLAMGGMYWCGCCLLMYYLCLSLSWWLLGAIIAPDYMLVVATAAVTLVVSTVRALTSYMELRDLTVQGMQDLIMECFLTVIRQTPADKALRMVEGVSKDMLQGVSGANLAVTAGMLMDSASTDRPVAQRGTAELAAVHGVPDAVILVLLAAANRTSDSIERAVEAAFRQLSVPPGVSSFATHMACLAAGAPTSTQIVASSCLDYAPEGLRRFLKRHSELVAGGIRAFSMHSGAGDVDRHLLNNYVAKTAAEIIAPDLGIGPRAAVDIANILRQTAEAEDITEALICRALADILAVWLREHVHEATEALTLVVRLFQETVKAADGVRNTAPEVISDILMHPQVRVMDLHVNARGAGPSSRMWTWVDLISLLRYFVRNAPYFGVATETAMEFTNALLRQDAVLHRHGLRLVVDTSRAQLESTQSGRIEEQVMTWQCSTPPDFDDDLETVLREAMSFHRRLRELRLERSAVEVDAVLTEALRTYGRGLLAAADKPQPGLLLAEMKEALGGARPHTACSTGRHVDSGRVMDSVIGLYLSGSTTTADAAALVECLTIDEDVLEFLVNPVALAEAYEPLRDVLPVLLHCMNRTHMLPRNTASVARGHIESKVLHAALREAGDPDVEASVRVYRWVCGATSDVAIEDLKAALPDVTAAALDLVVLHGERDRLLSYPRRVIEAHGALKQRQRLAAEDCGGGRPEGTAVSLFDCGMATVCREHFLGAVTPRESDPHVKCRGPILHQARHKADPDVHAQLYDSRPLALAPNARTLLVHTLSCAGTRASRSQRLLRSWAAVTILGQDVPLAAVQELSAALFPAQKVAAIAQALLLLRRNDPGTEGPAQEAWMLETLLAAVNDVRVLRAVSPPVSLDTARRAFDLLYPDDYTPLYTMQALAQGPLEKVEGLSITLPPSCSDSAVDIEALLLEAEAEGEQCNPVLRALNERFDVATVSAALAQDPIMSFGFRTGTRDNVPQHVVPPVLVAALSLGAEVGATDLALLSMRWLSGCLPDAVRAQKVLTLIRHAMPLIKTLRDESPLDDAVAGEMAARNFKSAEQTALFAAIRRADPHAKVVDVQTTGTSMLQQRYRQRIERPYGGAVLFPSIIADFALRAQLRNAAQTAAPAVGQWFGTTLGQDATEAASVIHPAPPDFGPIAMSSDFDASDLSNSRNIHDQFGLPRPIQPTEVVDSVDSSEGGHMVSSSSTLSPQEVVLFLENMVAVARVLGNHRAVSKVQRTLTEVFGRKTLFTPSAPSTEMPSLLRLLFGERLNIDVSAQPLLLAVPSVWVSLAAVRYTTVRREIDAAIESLVEYAAIAEADSESGLFEGRTSSFFNDQQRRMSDGGSLRMAQVPSAAGTSSMLSDVALLAAHHSFLNPNPKKKSENKRLKAFTAEYLRRQSPTTVRTVTVLAAPALLAHVCAGAPVGVDALQSFGSDRQEVSVDTVMDTLFVLVEGAAGLRSSQTLIADVLSLILALLTKSAADNGEAEAAESLARIKEFVAERKVEFAATKPGFAIVLFCFKSLLNYASAEPVKGECRLRQGFESSFVGEEHRPAFEAIMGVLANEHGSLTALLSAFGVVRLEMVAQQLAPTSEALCRMTNVVTQTESQQSSGVAERVAWQIFAEADRNANGEIDVREFRVALARLHFPLSEVHSKALFKELDVSGRGALVREDFLRGMLRVRQMVVDEILLELHLTKSVIYASVAWIGTVLFILLAFIVCGAYAFSDGTIFTACITGLMPLGAIGSTILSERKAAQHVLGRLRSVVETYFQRLQNILDV